MRFESIGFVGMGLIGGSIAKRIKQAGSKTKLYLLSRSENTVREAYEEGLTENETNADIKILAACDLIILCAPVTTNIEYLSLLAKETDSSALITDVGSVKGDIHRAVEALGLEERFIGGHPMAGTEKSGLRNAFPELLFGANYVLTPTAKSRMEDVVELTEFVEKLGANPLIIDYRRHDEAASAISHLPHMISYALADMVGDMDTDDLMKKMAAGGFRDMTRIAASSPEMWSSICLSNKSVIAEQIDEFTKRLLGIKKLIETEDEEALKALFAKAKMYKEGRKK